MPKNNLDQLRAEIRTAMEATGCGSVRKLAGMAGLSNTTMVDVMTHHQRPSIEWVTRVAEALNAPRSRWLRLAGYEVVPYHEPTADDVVIHFRNAFGLSAEEMAWVMDGVEEIKKKRDEALDGGGED